MKNRFHISCKCILFLLAVLFYFNLAGAAFCAGQPKMVLAESVMCEGISNFKPMNPAVVFSISQGEVFCFTGFDPVYETTYIFHDWYKRDELIFSMRLTLSPPKWSSFSRVQIREKDKGPWRVEIRDEDHRILNTLRFSMSD